MAKARKPKNNDDAKLDHPGAVVRHQKLCLSVDLPNRRIYGYTELEIAVPDIGIVGLHAENLGISSVLVDGEPSEYEYYPHYQNLDNERRWSSVMSPASAAGVAGSLYLSALDRELVPNLLINCCKGFKVENESQDQLVVENASQSSGEVKQNVKLVRIEYWVDKAETGIHFEDNILHTDNQIRRARCWFPCMDENSQQCCYDLEFTVAHDLVAVSTGKLLYQVLSKDDPPRKTYVYRLDVPVSAWWISLVVGPLEIFPDPQNCLISHMCLPAYKSKLQNTVGFFYSAFSSHYEEYLGAKFPFGSYKQIFIAPEMTVSSSSLGASMSIFSSQVLHDENIIDKTIDTRIRLAYALARQWFGVYIIPSGPDDEWLLDGLAGFLTDSYIKKYLGNNEARYRRFKANCAVCKADDGGATTLSSSGSCKDLYGTQSLGLYGKIRSWKSVAVLQMLEKQMGPESFCKMLQTIVARGLDATQPSRTLSTKEFRHFANKVGNLERPFLKEFFPRWVGSCGCPVLRMGFSYNKRKNMVELAVLRSCTAKPDVEPPNTNADSEAREAEVGWPGMMSIRVNELDGMYDHPILPMAGDSWQLLEIQCHSKLAARRFLKPKKGSRADGSDDNGDAAVDARSSSESPLLWIRADPEMEYIAEIHFNQPVQMWVNQLEKDKDVVAQAQAIATLEALPECSFAIVNALNNFLCDSKVFWRVRIEAAFALATTASEDTDWAGLLHLVKFYKGRRFDANIGLPKPNDFRDIPEYFVLEAIPHAVAMVRGADGKSPREAVEFVLQLLKTILLLSSLLKRIDRLLQFDRLMPSYNGILTVSCIRTLTQIALKFSVLIPLDRICNLIKPFRNLKSLWQVRVEASRALLDLEFQYKGLNAALSLFIEFLEEEPSLRGQTKLGMHAMRLCQMRGPTDSADDIQSITLVAFLRMLEGRMAFNNVFLRHYLFCILQIFAGRPPTLYGVPRDKTFHTGDPEARSEQENIVLSFAAEAEPLETPVNITNQSPEDVAIIEVPKEADSISSSHELKKPVVKIKVKHSTATSKGDEMGNQSAAEKSQGKNNGPDRAASSSVSVDAPQRNFTEAVSISNHNLEEVNSCQNPGSRVTASIGSAKLACEGDDLGKELQCTADSGNVLVHPRLLGDSDLGADALKYASLRSLSAATVNDSSLALGDSPHRKEKKAKSDKDKKRKREDRKGHKEDSEYLERKRLKKEKKRKEKELAKLLNNEPSKTSMELPSRSKGPGVKEPEFKSVTLQAKTNEVGSSNMLVTKVEARAETSEASNAPRFRIKIKNKPLNR
ncbi:transcription initiation factor TFIID subunit 2 isoform X3 [Rhodamnia argentea]|uniref:Transcription initiation factor TFIID subunit 2 n=1 Tax=Rhodamnia argentea TaxID=178133 RepID=A0ABM3HLW0_9MYRT|nr:transcription initiation factor TFIID subunit 2 isoform X3 [Rhodamnia argentea]